MNQFNTHCNLNGTTPTHQSAYKQFHSCETAFIKIVNDTLWAMEHKSITNCQGHRSDNVKLLVES